MKNKPAPFSGFSVLAGLFKPCLELEGLNVIRRYHENPSNNLFATVSINSFATGEWRGKVIELRASNVSNAVLFKLSGELEKPARCNEWKMHAIDLGHRGR